MGSFEGFNPPVHTQTPNELFDVLLPEIDSMAELKVLLFAIRKTLGWHKESDRLSLTQYQQGTGMCRETVVDGIARCLKRGTLRRVPEKGTYSYQLVLSQPVGISDQLGDSQSEYPTSNQSEYPTSEPEISRNIRPLASRNIRHTKETNKENKDGKEKEKEIPSLANAKDHGVVVPPEKTVEVSAGIKFYLNAFGRKRFRPGDAHRDGIVALIIEVGIGPFEKGVTWAAENGITNIDSLRTRCRNIAKNGPTTARAGPIPFTAKPKSLAEEFAMIDEVGDMIAKGGSLFGAAARE